MTHSDRPMIEACGLMKSFGAEAKLVLRGVDLTLQRGSVTGLLGKNGSGKSTLLKCLLGLLRLSSGQAKVLGEDPWNLSAGAKARLGYVPQEVSLYAWMRVRQIIEGRSCICARDEQSCRSKVHIRFVC